MSHVFVSYSRKDQLVIFALIYALEQQGIRFWIDRSSIEGGAYWDDSVEQAIEDAACVLLAVSSSAVQSANVKDELNKALELEKPIVPIRINNVPKMPMRFNRLQYIDFTEDYHRGMSLLAPRLLSLLPAEAQGGSSIIRTDIGDVLGVWEGGSAAARARIIFPEDKTRLERQRFPQLQVELQDGSQPLRRTWVMNIGSVTIGRSWHCDIIVEDQRISGNHAKVYWQNSVYLVEDLKSSNGTSLNGRALKSSAETLRDGDEIDLAGVCKIRFILRDPLDETLPARK